MNKTVIFLNGPARAGKDTVGDALGFYLGKDTVNMEKFAKPIKDGVQAAFNLTDEQRHELFETDAKDAPAEVFLGKTPRSVLISFSEDWLKPLYGSQVFGEMMSNRLDECDKEVTIITDCGFESELT